MTSDDALRAIRLAAEELGRELSDARPGPSDRAQPLPPDAGDPEATARLCQPGDHMHFVRIFLTRGQHTNEWLAVFRPYLRGDQGGEPVLRIPLGADPTVRAAANAVRLGFLSVSAA